MDPDAAPVTLDCRRVGVLPHALVRRLTLATAALATAGFAVLFALSLAYPSEALAPAWGTLTAGFALLASLGTGAGALLAQIACWIGPLARGRVTAGPADVRVASWRTREVPRAAIDAAWVLREPDGARAELRLRNGDVLSASVGSEEAAHALLDAAGLDPSRRALRMPLGGALTSLGLGAAASLPASLVAAITAGVLGTLLHLPSAAIGLLMFMLVTALVVGAVRLFAPPLVSVGHDGLSVEGARGAWFVRFDEVTDVAQAPAAISLRLRDGSTRSIATIGTGAARREALVARVAAGVAAGVEAAREPLDLSVRLTVLDRNGRSNEEWLAGLRALADAKDDYRSAGLTRDEVLGALADERSTPQRRIGAAYALSAMDPAQAGARVRVVAETVAQEPVRVALERAAAGEVDAEAIDAATLEEARR